MNTGHVRTIEQLVTQLAGLLLEKQLFLSTAESCTGGWIAQELTSQAGSSNWFDTGFVAYSDEAKQRLLNVPGELFKPGAPGAVSEDTVLAMTAGAIANSRARVAVAVSGIAGPGGGSPDKPVGTVWIAWRLDDRARTRRFRFEGDRRAVRRATVLEALRGLIALFEGEN